MSNTITPAELAAWRAAREKATQGEWAVRPSKYDDWGWIRAILDSGDNPLVACAKPGHYDHIDYDEHRKNSTDPHGDNAAFIVVAANNWLRLLAAHEEQAADIERLRGLAREILDMLCFHAHGGVEVNGQQLYPDDVAALLARPDVQALMEESE